MTRTSQSVPLNDSLKLVLLQNCTEDQLRHLLALKRADSPGMRARRSLDDASMAELAESIVNGEKLTIGWWRRHAA